MGEWLAEVSTKGLVHERRGRDVFEAMAEVMDELFMIAGWCGQMLLVRHQLDGDEAAWGEFATRWDLTEFLDRRFAHLGRWANQRPPGTPG